MQVVTISFCLGHFRVDRVFHREYWSISWIIEVKQQLFFCDDYIEQIIVSQIHLEEIISAHYAFTSH